MNIYFKNTNANQFITMERFQFYYSIQDGNNMNIKLSPGRRHYSAVKYIESNDEFIFILQDSKETSRLTKQLFLGHIGAMVAFITICLAMPAWVFAAANIFMSPKAAFVHIRCSKENLVLSRHYIRFGADKLLVPHPVSIGPQVLGRGEAEPPITISYSDIESLDWNGFAFELSLQGRENIIIQVKNAISSEMELVLEKARAYIQQRKEFKQNSLSFDKNEDSAAKTEDLTNDTSITIEKEVPQTKEEEIRRTEEIQIDETIEEPNLEIHQEDLSPFDTVIAEIKQRSSQLQTIIMTNIKEKYIL